jgi:putative copper resistance protein D
MRRLAQTVVVEATLGAMLAAIVAALGMTPPARHEPPTWPFAFRLSVAALPLTPGGTARTLLGSQLAVLALAAIVASRLLGTAGKVVLAAAVAALALALLIGLPPLALDAYPTTYRRPVVPYQAASIAEGARLYRDHCASCHAAGGPDLRGERVRVHTAGDLFWWISRGVPGDPAHAFDGRLGEEARWDLVNFIRALGDADGARAPGPVVEPDRPRLVAPDFTFAVGPTPPRALRDYRGHRIVLVVVYSLPGSRARLRDLAGAYDVLVTLGVEVIAVPTDTARDAIKRLGAEPRILFPVVTDGAPAILATYRLFGLAPHAEFLVDRQGYLRARWLAEGGVTGAVNALLAEVQQLNEEKTAAPPPEEHVH